MVKVNVLEKGGFVMRMHLGTATHPDNGEKIDISISGVTPVITYKGRLANISIQEMINEAVELIELELEKEDGI